MKPRAVFLAGWALGGLGAVIGSILGRAIGPTEFFVGALCGGILAVAGAAALLVKLRWLPPNTHWGALGGGLLGFAIAVPIAVATLHTPLLPIASCALVAAGLLFGAGVSGGYRSH